KSNWPNSINSGCDSNDADNDVDNGVDNDVDNGVDNDVDNGVDNDVENDEGSDVENSGDNPEENCSKEGNSSKGGLRNAEKSKEFVGLELNDETSDSDDSGEFSKYESLSEAKSLVPRKLVVLKADVNA
ncbi:6704_t:CDS:1, partial [Cetraspora pellucida]